MARLTPTGRAEISQTHQVPLDELVGAPEVGGPRVRFTPRSRNGRTVLP
jgi:hypothetical protein